MLGPGQNTTLFECVTAPEPARQAAIDELCWMIENAGRAGIRGLNYNFCPIPHQRTPETAGRGGALQSTFRLEEYDRAHRYSRGGKQVRMSKDEVYEKARYMLERIIPTAERWGVQMACHLEDPPAPELAGVEMWNWPVRSSCGSTMHAAERQHR